MVNYNNISREPVSEETKAPVEKLIREPFTPGTQVPVEKVIREPMVESVSTNETKLEPVSDESKYATVVCPSNLNVRKSADILSPVVHVLRNGDTVILEDVQDDWTNIQISPGIKGYSLSKYIIPSQAE